LGLAAGIAIDAAYAASGTDFADNDISGGEEMDRPSRGS
jgi:hypothetical protein